MPLGQQQRVSELQFLVYSRPLHPELFDIYQRRHLVKSGYETQIWVTGISHLIGFFRREAAIVELIAGADAELPERGKLMSMPVRGEKDREFTHAEGIKYMVSCQVETMSVRLYARSHEELTGLAERRGVLVSFPQWAVESLEPFTYIDYEAKLNELHVFAYHAFPDERTLIKTQSIFELI